MWKVSQGSEVAASSHLEIIKRIVHKTGFSKEVGEVVATDLRRFTSFLYQQKWSRFVQWCHGRIMVPCEVTDKQIAEVFQYLLLELKLFIRAIKGYRSALNNVFTLAGIDLTVSKVISRMFSSFKNHVFPERLSH